MHTQSSAHTTSANIFSARPSGPHLKQIYQLLRAEFKKEPKPMDPRKAELLWQRRRLVILDRDKYLCQRCRVSNSEHVGIMQDVNGKSCWEYPDDSLVTICPPCLVTNRLGAYEESTLLRSLNLAGFPPIDIISLSCLIDTDRVFTESLRRDIRLFANSNSISN